MILENVIALLRLATQNRKRLFDAGDPSGEHVWYTMALVDVIHLLVIVANAKPGAKLDELGPLQHEFHAAFDKLLGPQIEEQHTGPATPASTR